MINQVSAGAVLFDLVLAGRIAIDPQAPAKTADFSVLDRAPTGAAVLDDALEVVADRAPATTAQKVAAWSPGGHGRRRYRGPFRAALRSRRSRTSLHQVVGRATASAATRATNRTGRRDQLVEAAFHLVAEVGLEGLRLRQVADAVGIDHSTLHHHVATKQDLVSAVAEYTTRQFWTTMPADADPAAVLHGHLAALRTMVTERPELFTVTAELDLRARRDPSVRALLDRFEAGWRERLRDLLARGTRSGTWSPGTDVEATTELVIAVVKGARLAPATAGVVFDQLEALLTDAGSD